MHYDGTDNEDETFIYSKKITEGNRTELIIKTNRVRVLIAVNYFYSTTSEVVQIYFYKATTCTYFAMQTGCDIAHAVFG